MVIFTKKQWKAITDVLDDQSKRIEELERLVKSHDNNLTQVVNQVPQLIEIVNKHSDQLTLIGNDLHLVPDMKHSPLVNQVEKLSETVKKLNSIAGVSAIKDGSKPVQTIEDEWLFGEDKEKDDKK